MDVLSKKNFLTGHLEPIHTQFESIPLSFTGDMPTDINGMYFRNGPNCRYRPSYFHHLVDGDGMIHAFHFKESKVFYSNRWVNTTCFDLETAANRSLFGSMLYPTLCNPSVRKLKPEHRSKANTNIIFHGGKLLAMEESALPYQLEVNSLKTVSQLKMNNPNVTSLSGHPKIDTQNGDMLCVNWHSESSLPKCSYTRFSKNGDIFEYQALDAPYRAIIHDISVTKNYVIIPLFPLIIDLEMAIKNKQTSLLKWQPQLSSYVGIFSKNNPSDLKWFEIPNCYVMHTCNSYEKDNLIVLDLIVHNSPPIFCELDVKVSRCEIAQLQRWLINVDSGKITMIDLDSNDFIYNFPRIKQNQVGSFHDKIYACGSLLNNNKNTVLNSDSIIMFDTDKNVKLSYHHGDEYVSSEPVIIRGDKYHYIGSLWFNKKHNNTEFILHYEDQLDQKPILTIHIPHRIPYGFHGNWYSQNELNVLDGVKNA